MAEKLTVPGTQFQVKPRHPVAVGFLSLTIVYVPFYWYAINKEMKQLGEARGVDLGTSPMLSALAGSLGWLVIVPPFWTGYTTADRVRTAQLATGRKDWLEGWIALVILLILPPMMFGLIQDQLNKVWQNLGLPTPMEAAAVGPGPGYYAGHPAGPPPPPPEGYAPPPPPGYRPPEAPPPR